jgi:Tfp pilus assembly protein PilN
MTLVTSPEQDVAEPAIAGGFVPFRMARVNLLPPEIEEARRLRRTRGVLAGGLAAVVVVLGAGYAYTIHDRQDAERDLADVQARTAVLRREQAKYADVPRVTAAIDAAEGARQTALANDVEWARTLTDFSLSLPERVRFTSLTLSVGGAAGATPGTTPGAASAATSGAASGAAAATAPTTSGQAGVAGGIGTVVVEGSARSNRDVATWLDTLAKRPGLTNPYFSTAQQEKVGKHPIVKFSSTATLTGDALSHRYDRKQG